MFKKIIIILSIVPTTICATELPKRWTGFYVGGNVGGIFNSTTVNAQHIAMTNWNGVCNQNNQFNSVFIGPQAGLIRQFDSNLVLGVEGDFTYNFSQDKQLTCQCDTHPEFYDQFNISNQNQGSIRGRFGYAFKQNFLPFFTAGLSFSKLDMQYINEVNDQYQTSKTQPGWVVGGGLEWSYSEKLSARFEYGYNQYNSLGLAVPTIYGLDDPVGGAHFKLSTNTIRGVINYWF